MSVETKSAAILPLEEYYKVPKIKQNMSLFRDIAKHYKIRIKPKRKQEFINELHDKMKELFYVKKIQRVVRSKFRRILVNCHGPAYNDPKCCVNDTDFYTLDNIADIPAMYIFSYKDEKNKVYGFHWYSFLKLISGDGKTPNSEIYNPYNRELIKKPVLQMFAKFVYLSNKVFKINLSENVEDEPIMSKQVRYQQRLTDIFMKIDSLGNYSQIEWYNSLNHHRTVRFIQELKDIWAYRLNLSHEMKRNIIGNYDPFHTLNIGTLINVPLEELKIFGLNIIEKFITSGRTNEYKTLGSIYVLSALTLVNQNAAMALPHLYESLV
tara:strand:+ start:39056 stop:40024 length:969 start_codon:yes stop_codon:yes gene_type:complete